jgi:hypothetical protein
MADILQYELFSTCKRLCAEPIVDASIAKNVVFRLCDLAENSPFPSQRARVLKYLHALVHTPHSADLARTALISLLTHDTLVDTHTRIQLILTLYATSSPTSNERQLAQQAFVRLVQRSDFAFEQVIKAAQTISEDDNRRAEARQQVTQLVLDIAEQSDLTIEQLLAAFWMLSDNRLSTPKIRKRINSILFTIAQRATTSSEDAINIAEMLYQTNARNAKVKQQAIQLFLDIAQQRDIPFTWAVEAAFHLYWISPPASQERQQAAQMLLEQACWPDITVEQSAEAALALYNVSQGGWVQEVVEILLDLARRPDLSVLQTLELAVDLSMFGSLRLEERLQTMRQILRKALERSDLTFEQKLTLAHQLGWYSDVASEEWQLSTHVILELAGRTDLSLEQVAKFVELRYLPPQVLEALSQRPDFTVEQRVSLAIVLYKGRAVKAPETQQAVSMLSTLIQQPNLSIEERTAIAKGLYQCSRSLKMRWQATQTILELAQHPDLTVEQALQIHQAFSWKTLSAGQSVAVDMLLSLAQREHLATEDAEKIAHALYHFCQAKQGKAQKLQKQTGSFEHFFLHMATTILQADEASYWEKAEAVRMLRSMLQTEVARYYLKESWRPTNKEANTLHKLYIEELAGEETLPVAARDEMYMMLRKFKLDELASSHTIYTDLLSG